MRASVRVRVRVRASVRVRVRVRARARGGEKGVLCFRLTLMYLDWV